MTKYMQKTVLELHELLKTKKTTVEQLIETCLNDIEASKGFIFNKEETLAKAKMLDDQEVDNELYGLPIIINDNIAVKGEKLNAGVKILENYTSPFDATVVKKLKEKKMVVAAKAKANDFSDAGEENLAMALANKKARLALSSSNLRKSAVKHNLIAMKATYGRVSRYGLVSRDSSLKQIGPLTIKVYDNALLLSAISGRDDKDLTSSSKDTEDYTKLIGKDIKALKIGFIKNKNNSLLFEKLKKLGIAFDEVEIGFKEEAELAYKVIYLVETSSNLARYDGVRYGYRAANVKTVDELYEQSRADGFSRELKENIILGSYLVSGENAKIYHDKAMMIRAELKDLYDDALSKYDLLISSADESILLQTNLTGHPSLTMLIDNEYPIQILANNFEEAKIYQLASYIENKAGDLNV